MKRLFSKIGMVGAILVGLTIAGEFIDGLLCTRISWFVIAPIELLYLPAIPVLVLGVTSSLVLTVLALKRRAQIPALCWRSQLLACAALLLMYFGAFSPRLAGLLVRARFQEEKLVDLCRKYRSGGDGAIAGHEVLSWNSGLQSHLRSTKDYVEISWGATLPVSWGFRIDDRDSPVPWFVSPSDAEAAAATRRITAFIGIW